MKFTTALFALALFAPAAHPADPCTGSDSKTTDQESCPESPENTSSATLPESAVTKIEKLRVDLRYMRATGHPVEAQKKKDAIAMIYQEHAVPLPDGFDNW
jgi:hypothetical protein